MSDQALGSNPGAVTVPDFNIFSEPGVSTDPNVASSDTGASQAQPAPSQPPAQPAPTTTAPPSTGAPQPQVQPNTVQPQVTPPAVALTPEQLTQFIQSVQGTGQQASAAEIQPTPEEVDQQFAVIRPSQDQLDTLFRGGPQAVSTMTEMLHGAARMGATIAAHHAVGQLKKFKEYVDGKLGPVTQATEKQMMQEHTQAFYQQYEHLKPYEPVLVSVYNNLVSAGYKGAPAEVYAKVAEEATRLIRTVNPNFGPPQQQQGQQPQNGAVTNQPAQQQQQVTQKPVSQMTALSMGGGGSGGAAPSSATGTKTMAENIFG